jgi:response regulator RpfG family c-di-GMP phosphodiesterase
VRIDIEQPLTVMIAERHRTIAQSLSSLVGELGNAEVVAEVGPAAEALEIGRTLAPDVAILDLELSPSCSLVSLLTERTPDTRIVILGDRDRGTPAGLVKALASGAVGAIYRDEMSFHDLTRAIHSSSRRRPVVAEEAAGVLLSSYVGALSEKRQRDHSVINALAAAVEARDADTGHHLRRVTDLAIRCITEIDDNMARNEEIQYGFTLHDVGKIGVPDKILNKPGPLSVEEWSVMRTHPELGAKIVEPIGFSSATMDIIRHHHERWDGKGYPTGLKGAEIPLAARAFAVADSYDAMTSERPYRAAMTDDEAIRIIVDERDGAFDPDIVDVFLGLCLKRLA